MQQEGDGIDLPLNPCATFGWGAVIDAEITLSGGTCEIEGCTDPLANNYNPNASVDDGSCSASTGNHHDCIGATPLCAGETYSSNLEDFTGIGDVTNEFSTSNTCFSTSSTGDVEINSQWYTFTVQNDGELNFTITPETPVDYDWAVFDISSE